MSFTTLRTLPLLAACLMLSATVSGAGGCEPDQLIKVSIQKRIPSELDEGAFIMVNEIQEWQSHETAIIICDMWDKHWCTGATNRVAEMAPVMNDIVSIARERGVLIVHAPSDCMEYYSDHPARKLGKKYKSRKVERMLGDGPLESEKGAEWPFEISGGGCDDKPRCKIGKAWTKQIETIDIVDGDLITDSGIEAGSFFLKRGIKNVILVGVHTNMCVIGRSFGLRNMIRLGMNVVLMRDMTDTMYDAASWPNVSHFTGNSLMHEYIEKFVCPTMVSTDFTGRKQFRFKNDTRKVIAFVMAEGEYRSNQRLPEFAHGLLLTRNVNSEFAIGKPAMRGEGRHNIENLQIMRDADLAVLFVRRRALEHQKMELIRQYIQRGKPVIGIRTASHAFDVRDDTSALLSGWPDFDEEILGGNYQGHYGRMEEGVSVSIIPGMEHHPLLHGIDPEGFSSPSTLYKNRPLRSCHAQVLLLGTISGQPAEPVLWLNTNKYGKVISNALGHPEDWENENFHTIMMNSIDYFLDVKTK